MAVLEIGMISGFVPDRNTLHDLLDEHATGRHYKDLLFYLQFSKDYRWFGKRRYHLRIRSYTVPLQNPFRKGTNSEIDLIKMWTSD